MFYLPTCLVDQAGNLATWCRELKLHDGTTLRPYTVDKSGQKDTFCSLKFFFKKYY